MKDASDPLDWLMYTAMSYLGTPYRWGGDDPSGFDCSGFIVECLKTAGLLGENEDLTADGLYRRFRSLAIGQPERGALLFTLDESGHARHVVLCLDERFWIGAAGGTTSTTDVTAAWQDNAWVRIRPIRLDKRRYRLCRLPFS